MNLLRVLISTLTGGRTPHPTRQRIKVCEVALSVSYRNTLMAGFVVFELSMVTDQEMHRQVISNVYPLTVLTHLVPYSDSIGVVAETQYLLDAPSER